ncbi:hypothetical protein [Caudoviricetes sp.]|nr:hypothetical protein [Caudoviricetes sp.]
MYHKYYLSRRQTKSMSIDHPIGDPTGGAAYREMNDPVTAGISVVGSLAGSLISSNAARSAGQAQADAAEKAARLQQETANAQIPVLKTIYGDQNKYLSNLYNAQYGAQREIYGQNTANLFPYTTVGQTGATQLNDLANSGYFSKQFGPADLYSNLSPNYEFMKGQGLGAVTQTLNVGGGGSNIVRGATKFAEDYASNAYQQAFNNFQTQRTGIYNTLSGLAGIGINANTQQIASGGQFSNALGNLYGPLAQTTTSNAQNLGTGITNLAVGGANAGAAGITGAAQANASGTVGSANAISGGISNAANTYALSQLLAPKTPIPTGSTPVAQTGIYNPGTSGITVGGTSLIGGG